MLRFIKHLRQATVLNRGAVMSWYYAHWFRGEDSARAPMCAKVSVGENGSALKVPLWNLGDARQLVSTFSRNNPWNRFEPIAEPATILDLGANNGMSCLYWQARYPEAVVHGVEMDGANCQRTMQLAAENGLGIQIHQVAIAAVDGPIEYRPHGCGARHRLNDVIAGDNEYNYVATMVQVPGVTLASLVRQLNVEMVDILKVDIEGAEQYLLDSVDDWKDLVKDVLLEVHHNIDTKAARRTLTEAGFSVTTGDEHGRTEWWCRRA